jgi:predicted anti-sigma-YlaC factor YlaD
VITCADFMTEIGNLLDGEVAAEVRLQLEGHLSHCQSCQVLYDSARKTVRIVTDSGSFDLSEDASRSIAAKIMARLRETKVNTEPEPNSPRIALDP